MLWNATLTAFTRTALSLTASTLTAWLINRMVHQYQLRAWQQET
jgi:ABC-type glycerol-3-phosphate transport system permease component